MDNHFYNPLNASRISIKRPEPTGQTNTLRGGVCGDHRVTEELRSGRNVARLDLSDHRLNSCYDGIGRANLSDVAGQDVRDGWLTASNATSDLTLRASGLDEGANQALKINFHDS